MAYALKYRLEFTNGKGNTYRADIYQDDYVGAVSEYNMAGQPMILNRDDDQHFLGTSLQLGIEAKSADTFGLEDLYSENPRKNRVDLYRNGFLCWRGFVQPEEYSDPYVAPPFDIFVTATDGLGTLKNFDFELSGLHSELAILNHCLANLDVELQVAIAIQVHAENMLTSRAPLAQSNLNCEIFYDDDGKPNTCYEVIEKLLNSFGEEVYITQESGMWKVFRTLDIESSYSVYNTDNSYSHNTNLSNTRQLNKQGSGTAYPIGRLEREIIAPLKKATLEVDYLKKYTMHPHGLFASNEFSGLYSSFWKVRGTQVDGPRYRISADGVRGMNLLPYNEEVECVDNLMVKAGTSPVVFAFKHATDFGSIAYGGLEVSIRCGTKWLGENGWGDSEHFFEDNAIAVDRNQIKTFTIQADPFPEDGELAIFFKTPYTDGRGDWLFSQYVYEVIVKYDDDVVSIPSGLEQTVLINQYSTRNDSFELIGDIPQGNGIELQYFGGKRYANGEPMQNWRHQGDTSDFTLVDIVSRTLASNNRIARQKLAGTLVGNNLAFNSIVQHALNSNRKFFIQEGSFDLWSEELRCTLIELLPYSEVTYVIDQKELYADTKKTVISANANKDYVTYGAGVGVGKRVHELPTASSYLNKHIVIDGPNQQSAEKVPYVESVPKATFDDMFELVPNNGHPYIRTKYNFAGVGSVMAYASSPNMPASIWDAMPIASADSLGGIKVGNNLTIDEDGTLHAQAASGGASSWSELSGKPTWLAHATQAAFEGGHGHAWSQIGNKPTVFPPSQHVHDWDDLENKPNSYPPSAHSHTWDSVTGKPSIFPPASHSHAWSAITGKPSSYTPASHNHAIDDVTGLQTALNGKLNSNATASNSLQLGGHNASAYPRKAEAAIITAQWRFNSAIRISDQWSIGFDGTDLVFYNSGGTRRAKIDQNGNLTASGEVTAYGTV